MTPCLVKCYYMPLGGAMEPSSSPRLPGSPSSLWPRPLSLLDTDPTEPSSTVSWLLAAAAGNAASMALVALTGTGRLPYTQRWPGHNNALRHQGTAKETYAIHATDAGRCFVCLFVCLFVWLVDTTMLCLKDESVQHKKFQRKQKDKLKENCSKMAAN